MTSRAGHPDDRATVDYAHAPPEPQPGWLLGAAALALALESVALVAVGIDQHWIAHPGKKGLDTTQYLEAQVFTAPPEPAHLVEEKKVAVPTPKEAAISKRVDQGRKAKPDEPPPPDRNVTESGPPPLPTHGPIAVSMPTPQIPEYLKSQELKASAVIDFYVSAIGGVDPRLVGSTGNEELDALALATARKWQFRPAEKDHKPVDSKVRLRIVFEVK